MNAVTLILIAPCSLLLGAALQILAGRLFSARTKGILAFAACLPAVLAVALTARWVQAGQAYDQTLFHWDGLMALAFHVDALSVLFALMGTGLGWAGASTSSNAGAVSAMNTGFSNQLSGVKENNQTSLGQGNMIGSLVGGGMMAGAIAI